MITHMTNTSTLLRRTIVRQRSLGFRERPPARIRAREDS
jgi:hypothetical protein